jgi:acetyltransferase-like isoleucine patch superfamily enzyme
MKAYIFNTQTTISPFNDPVGESFIGGQTLNNAIEKALEELKITFERVSSSSQIPLSGSYLIFPDSLFFSRQCIDSFIQISKATKTVCRLALTKGAVTDYALPLQAVEDSNSAIAYDLFRINDVEIPRDLNWSQLHSFLNQRSNPIELTAEVSTESIYQSRPHPPWTVLELPQTMIAAVNISHWIHILLLNHYLPSLRISEQVQDNPKLKLKKNNIIGEDCDIHPTAYVEGSIIGDGVRLGPFTSIRNSIIGNRVEVADHSKFLRCVVGDDCHTLNDSYFIGCTFYPKSTLASFMLRNTILGRRVFITSGVMFWDEGMQEPVSVSHQGNIVSTGRWNLGGCAGHECILGTRAIFLPGREVPNQTMIVMRPEEGVVKLPEQAEPYKPHVYHQGKIVPLEQALPDWKPLEID